MRLEPLAFLIGSWDIVGRSDGVDHDNIRGRVAIRPFLDGQVLQLTGTMRPNDGEMEDLEFVWPDPAGGLAHVYSSRGEPLRSRWDRAGATVTHAGSGATDTGTISEDGATITGRWPPDPGQPVEPGSADDAVMRRVG